MGGTTPQPVAEEAVVRGRASSAAFLPATVLALLVALPVASQGTQPEPTPIAAAETSAHTVSVDASGDSDGSSHPASRPNPCAAPDTSGGSWIDRFNRSLDKTVCQSSLWFDSFFGNSRAVDEYHTTGGLVSTHLYYTDYDGFTPRFSFRAHYTLPNLNNKFDAFIGRQSRDEYLTDTAERDNSGNPYLGLDEEERMLVGLGWNPRRGREDQLRLSAGVQLGFPVNPYVQARYRYLYAFGDRNLFRWRQTVFYELEDQLGTTSHFDLEHRFGHAVLVRWTSSGTVSGGVDGVDWWSHVTLFQGLSPHRALAYTIFDSGETGGEVPVTEYGVRIVYRQRVSRDWLFVDVGPILSWPRHHLEEPRKPSWGAVLGVEMLFGTWR